MPACLIAVSADSVPDCYRAGSYLLRQFTGQWYDLHLLKCVASRDVENMALKKTFCLNHPDRPAIGICVMTGQAICEECSTRYEGVNYSREGLRILQAQRGAAHAARRWPDRIWLILATLLSPLCVLMIYFGMRTLIFYLGLRN
jgi:hypothetical protein